MSALAELEGAMRRSQEAGDELAYLKAKDRRDRFCRAIKLQLMVFEELNTC